MLLEITSLYVKTGQEMDFELAFQTTQKSIARTAGHLAHELHRDVQHRGHYALLIEWRDGTPAQQEAAWLESLRELLSAPPDQRRYERVAAGGNPPLEPLLPFPD